MSGSEQISGYAQRLASRLPPDAYAAIKRRSRRCVIRQAHNVFVEGEHDGGLYVLTHGLIKVNRQSFAGDQQLIAILGRGDFVGELALCDGGPRSATATAIVDSNLEYISKQAFFECADEHPSIYRVLLNALSERLRDTNDSFAQNQFLPVSGQVAAVLLRLAHAVGRSEEDDSIVIEQPITHKDIASMIGAARENVSRAIGQLRRQGIIKTHHSILILRDVKRLQSMSLI